MERNKVVYVHKKKTNGSVFYVGMGTLSRAYSTQRSNWWKGYAKKYGYDVEIIASGLTKEEAWALEIELIAKYGRLDLKTGCLVNQTSGGNSVSNISKKTLKKKIKKFKQSERTKEWKENISKALKGKPKSEEFKKMLSKYHIGAKRSDEVKRNMSNASRAEELKGKPVGCYDFLTGVHLISFPSVCSAARYLRISAAAIFSNIFGRSKSVHRNSLNRKLKFKYIETNRKVHSSKDN